jgi:lipopolysaccharide export system permease protein
MAGSWNANAQRGGAWYTKLHWQVILALVAITVFAAVSAWLTAPRLGGRMDPEATSPLGGHALVTLLRDRGVEVVVAKRGEQRDSDDPNMRFFVLHDGRRYEGIPGTSEFRVMEFAEHGIPYRLPNVTEEPELEPRAMTTANLLRSADLNEIAELHWRVGIPLATVVLAVVAVPLSRSQPRQGRYGRLAVGLLVFIIYFNLMSAGKAWLEQGTVPAYAVLWWVHVLMLALGIGMVGAQNGWHRRIPAVRAMF